MNFSCFKSKTIYGIYKVFNFAQMQTESTSIPPMAGMGTDNSTAAGILKNILIKTYINGKIIFVLPSNSMLFTVYPCF
jgi:hypothetical protein